jgi:hypothetical protein
MIVPNTAGLIPQVLAPVEPLYRRRIRGGRMIGSIDRSFVHIVLFALLLLRSTPWANAAVDTPEQSALADSIDLRITPALSWGEQISYDQPNKPILIVSLVARGGVVAKATAGGEFKVDSVKDDAGHAIDCRGISDTTGMCWLIQNQGVVPVGPGGNVQVSFNWVDPPPLRKLSELRGSFALRTGGRLQEVVLKNAFRKTKGVIEDATLKSLGITVHIARTTWPAPEKCDKSAFSFTVPPGDPSEAQEILEFDMGDGKPAPSGYAFPSGQEVPVIVKPKTANHPPLVRLEVTDGDGKPFMPLRSECTYDKDGSIERIKLSFAERLPASSQLRLTVHRDPKEIRVPFVLKDVRVPPKENQETSQLPVDVTWVPAVLRILLILLGGLG